MLYDVIVIGNGPAGISASIYIKRNNLNVLILSSKESSLLKADKIENYYGFIAPISGEELYNNGIEQAKNLGIEIKKEEVLDIQFVGNYEVTTTLNTYAAKSIILATGMNRAAPRIDGLKKFEGKGISYCAVCDGFFYRQKDVVVIGNKEYALHEANVLKQFAKSVTLLTNGLDFNLDTEISVNKLPIKQIKGNDVVEEIVFTDESIIKVDGVFIALGVASSIDFAKKLGIEIKNNKIVVNGNMETNMPGVYACGDVLSGTPQIAKAVYEGMVAGLEVSKYIRKK